MARVTVEDCVEKVDNRFELVALAAQRAKTISAGGAITIARDNDKDSVIALREIAEETVLVDDLRNQVTQNFQRPIDIEEDELDTIEQSTDASADDAATTEDFVENAGDTAGTDEITEMLEEETEASIVETPAEDGGTLSFEEDNLDVKD